MHPTTPEAQAVARDQGRRPVAPRQEEHVQRVFFWIRPSPSAASHVRLQPVTSRGAPRRAAHTSEASMSVSLSLLRYQGPQLAAMGAVGLATLKKASTRAPKLPGTRFTRRFTASEDLVRTYLAECGGDAAAYAGRVPAHLFCWWSMPVMSQALRELPYAVGGVLNAGCTVTVNSALPTDTPLYTSAQVLEAVDKGRRVLVTLRLTTGATEDDAAIVVDARLLFPSPGPKPPKKERSGDKPPPRTIPEGADLLATWPLAGRAGLDFALLTGDFNPIHWVPARGEGRRLRRLHPPRLRHPRPCLGGPHRPAPRRRPHRPHRGRRPVHRPRQAPRRGLALPRRRLHVQRGHGARPAPRADRNLHHAFLNAAHHGAPMSDDLLVKLGANPTSRSILKALGLPIPIPQKLARMKAAFAERSLSGKLVLVGSAGEGQLDRVLADTFGQLGADVALEGLVDGPWAEAASGHQIAVKAVGPGRPAQQQPVRPGVRRHRRGLLRRPRRPARLLLAPRQEPPGLRPRDRAHPSPGPSQDGRRGRRAQGHRGLRPQPRQGARRQGHHRQHAVRGRQPRRRPPGRPQVVPVAGERLRHLPGRSTSTAAASSRTPRSPRGSTARWPSSRGVPAASAPPPPRRSPARAPTCSSSTAPPTPRRPPSSPSASAARLSRATSPTPALPRSSSRRPRAWAASTSSSTMPASPATRPSRGWTATGGTSPSR